MGVVHLDMVEQSATYSSGVFTLGDALPGRRRFADAGGDAYPGDLVYYRAMSGDGAAWEVGLGVLDGDNPQHLTRDSIVVSSSGSEIEFGGDVTVACVAPACCLPVATPDGTIGIGGDVSQAVTDGMALGNRSGVSADYAVALGADTNVYSEGAVAIGWGTETRAPWSMWYGRSFFWAGSENTDGSDVYLSAGGTDGLDCTELNSAVVSALVIGRRDDDGAVKAMEIKALVTNTGTVAIVGTPVVTDIGSSAGVTVTAALEVVGSVLAVRCTGESGQYWRWSCSMRGAAA